MVTREREKTPQGQAGKVETQSPRVRLLAGIPVRERRVGSGGISTAVLEGGEGAPLLLLHGPGESAINWRWVIPGLVGSHRVIAPDLPAHGSTDVPRKEIDAELVLAWLQELVDRTCVDPPIIVGHVLGGAIAARFAMVHPERVSRLVLVDTLGLARFRPSLTFALGMFGFLARPNERTYERFMRQCAFDLDALRGRMAGDWEPFVSYNLISARSPKAKAAGRMLRRLGLPRIPPGELARLSVPTSLIWGRNDRANRLRVAQQASARYGWPLHIIERAADDPARDRPEAFLDVLRQIFHEEATP